MKSLPSCFQKSSEGICDLYIVFQSQENVFEFVVMRRSLLTQTGKNIFRKSTALQSTDR